MNLQVESLQITNIILYRSFTENRLCHAPETLFQLLSPLYWMVQSMRCQCLAESATASDVHEGHVRTVSRKRTQLI